MRHTTQGRVAATSSSPSRQRHTTAQHNQAHARTARHTHGRPKDAIWTTTTTTAAAVVGSTSHKYQVPFSPVPAVVSFRVIISRTHQARNITPVGGLRRAIFPRGRVNEAEKVAQLVLTSATAYQTTCQYKCLLRSCLDTTGPRNPVGEQRPRS